VSKDECADQERARLEHCPECKSVEVKNNMYFCKGQPVRVYVQCAKCGGFVARYTLRAYTSNKTYESLLRRFRSAKLTSGKRALHIVGAFGDDVRREYEHAIELVATREDQRRMEDIIAEDHLDDLG
jgi:hypothetical protein